MNLIELTPRIICGRETIRLLKITDFASYPVDKELSIQIRKHLIENLKNDGISKLKNKDVISKINVGKEAEEYSCEIRFFGGRYLYLHGKKHFVWQKN